MTHKETVKAIIEDNPRAAEMIKELIIEKLREDPEIQAAIKAEQDEENMILYGTTNPTQKQIDDCRKLIDGKYDFSAEISAGPIMKLTQEEFPK